MATMTHECKDCGATYGKFRPRCPACGTNSPFVGPRCKHGMVERFCAVCNGTVRATPQKTKGRRVKRGKRERERRPNECIFCRHRAKGKRATTCPHCNEPIHTKCLEFHRDDCLKFQLEVEAINNRKEKVS